jgi:mRNA interferase MazF
MHKDFDQWNTEKKIVHSRGAHKLYHEREIWWVTLGTNIGFEQDGTGEGHQRPVIILKGFSRHVCLIIPLTSSRKRNPYHFELGMIEGREAAAIISQLRLIDVRRLVDKVGMLDKKIFAGMRKAVKDML